VAAKLKESGSISVAAPAASAAASGGGINRRGAGGENGVKSAKAHRSKAASKMASWQSLV